MVLIAATSDTSTKTTLPLIAWPICLSVFSVSHLQIGDKHSYYFLSKEHYRENSSLLHKSKRIYPTSESREGKQWHLGLRWATRHQAQVSAGAPGEMGKPGCMGHLVLHGQNHHHYYCFAAVYYSPYCSLSCFFKLLSPLALPLFPLPHLQKTF